MILKVEESSYPYGWSYFDKVANPVVSGRLRHLRLENDGLAFLAEASDGSSFEVEGSPRWAWNTLHWMVTAGDGDGPTMLAVQWQQGNDTHVLVTRRSAYLMSDDGKTVDRL